MKPIYTGPIGEGIRILYPFQLKHHESIRTLLRSSQTFAMPDPSLNPNDSSSAEQQAPSYDSSDDSHRIEGT
jgi:hypothetical protein